MSLTARNKRLDPQRSWDRRVDASVHHVDVALSDGEWRCIRSGDARKIAR
jgi:hypothetical protein